MPVSRRQLLARTAAAAGAANLSLAAWGQNAPTLQPTGTMQNFPEYVRGAPIRTSFLPDADGGERVRLAGRVLTTGGDPVADARLDFWHTDAAGAYDMDGYRFRGAQRTDRQGRFLLDTVMPAPYMGNPRHIHFLLTKRFADRAQPIFVANAVFFPTSEEFARAAPAQRTRDFLPPDAMPLVRGVLLAQCDIVVEPA